MASPIAFVGVKGLKAMRLKILYRLKNISKSINNQSREKQSLLHERLCNAVPAEALKTIALTAGK